MSGPLQPRIKLVTGGLPILFAPMYSWFQILPGRYEIALSGLPERQSAPFPQAEFEGLSDWRHSAEALALPELRSSILRLVGSPALCSLRALR